MIKCIIYSALFNYLFLKYTFDDIFFFKLLCYLLLNKYSKLDLISIQYYSWLFFLFILNIDIDIFI